MALCEHKCGGGICAGDAGRDAMSLPPGCEDFLLSKTQWGRVLTFAE